MGIRIYKPTTAARRRSSVDDFSDITKKEPEKSLIIIKKRKGGRNKQGRVTVRHRGGGAKRFIRVIDWRQIKYDVPAAVEAIEYDPNRGARIALIKYKTGEKAYIVAPLGIKVGDEVMSSLNKIEVKAGNRMPLKYIPLGLTVHNIELQPTQGAKLARGAGLGVQILAFEDGCVHLKLPSGEIRKVSENCSATIGSVSNSDHRLIRWGKAGRTRLKGRRPEVRGKAMNPVDHPHGGGEGGNPIGLKHPKTPWGKPALGVKTRKKKKYSDKFIIRRRSKKRR
jgi:large subunit ribosomal protein L2